VLHGGQATVSLFNCCPLAAKWVARTPVIAWEVPIRRLQYRLMGSGYEIANKPEGEETGQKRRRVDVSGRSSVGTAQGRPSSKYEVPL